MAVIKLIFIYFGLMMMGITPSLGLEEAFAEDQVSPTTSPDLPKPDLLKVDPKIDILYKKKDYPSVAKYYDNDLTKIQQNHSAAFMVAYSLDAVGRHSDAIALYKNIIDTFYKTAFNTLTKGKSTSTLPALKILIFRLHGTLGKKILVTYEKGASLTALIKEYQLYHLLINRLEYEENAVERLNSKVGTHLSGLEARRFRFKKRIFIDYVSWQNLATLQSTGGGITTLVLTNSGLCPGFGMAYQNNQLSFSGDLCFVYGSGAVNAPQGLTYQQSGIKAYGGKVNLGAGWIVSSTRAEFGAKIGGLMIQQTLKNPPSQFGYTVSKLPVLTFLGSIYSQWIFGNWGLQTEFGRALTRDTYLWSIGGSYYF